MTTYRDENYDPFVDEEARLEIETGLKERLDGQFGQESIFISAYTKENIDLLQAKR
ncbi:MAG: hypothetical protein R2795_26340 [Saprospiraceae bacterium]